MRADSRLIIWLVGMLVLGIGILLGVIIARRTRKKETHIQELEEQLSQSREELAEYRTQVDDTILIKLIVKHLHNKPADHTQREQRKAGQQFMLCKPRMKTLAIDKPLL